MSDIFDDLDLFAVDDSFFQEVDEIAAQAAARQNKPNAVSPYLTQVASNHNVLPSPQRIYSTGTTLPNSTHAALGFSRLKPPLPDPSSDDYGDLTFSAESLAQLDAAVSRPNGKLAAPSAGFSGSSSAATRKSFHRSSSGKDDGLLQTHLNFRKERQYTKGKRWDRTAFAASGRRIGTEKMKNKPLGTKKRKRGGNEDEDEDSEDECEEEEYDWEESLAPPPKPLVDIGKPYEPQRHSYNEVTMQDYIYPTNRSKRDYQYEIIRACFTDNCLVALPTGLGKTFVAGVVMLNFYRWFPSGKIVFLAPTKPLVNQQIEACQLSCGIPSADAAVMTGQSVSAKERSKLWSERRVFYCTPQTLDNDLKNGSVDPRDIVLAVFDEAHKASGSYAYTTILAYITAHHPYFRVLALTATPGADIPKVQAVVDALHISRIEIREAEAPEIRRYMNEKRTEKHFVRMGSVIEEFRDRWAALMKPYIAKLVEKEILTERDLDAKRLRPFRITAKRMDIARNRNSGLQWTIGPLGNIERMARAMGHLLEFSVGMFHTSLLEISGGSTSEGKKGNSRGGANSVRNNIEFQRLLRDVESEINNIRSKSLGRTKADKHPKMEKTLELLLAHFVQADEDEKVHGIKNDTRAMVFCSFRDCVLEIVDMLNDHPALLRATKFVGQSQGKQARDKGFNQKEQKKTISEFKEGRFNILVATSIGEEGLDIGEVDFVVIYDMPKQSIKLLQRIGRTGRKRDGQVHVLMSENREDANWDSAQQTHREIQEEILHSRNLELFEDVERLLPPGDLPRCVEQLMEVDPWDPSDQKHKRKLLSTSKRGNTKATKTTRETKTRGHDIPEGANDGFKTVAQLIKERTRRSNKRLRELESDDDSEEEDEKATSELNADDNSDDDDSDVEEDPDLLYGKVGSFRKKPSSKRAVSRRQHLTETKATGSESSAVRLLQETAAARQERESQERRNKMRETINRSAIDFFNTQGPIRRRSPLLSPQSVSTLSTPPSSPPFIDDGD